MDGTLQPVLTFEEDDLQAHPEATSCKVLLLDNDSVSSTQLSATLRELTCEVMVVAELDAFAVSGVIAQVAREPFDLILVASGADAAAAELIADRIKHDPRSASVPVVVLGTGTVAHHSRRDRLATALPWLPRPAATSQTRLSAVPPALDEDEDDNDWGEDGLGPDVDALLRDIADEEARALLERELSDRGRELVRVSRSLAAARAAREKANAEARASARRSARNSSELLRTRVRLAGLEAGREDDARRIEARVEQEAAHSRQAYEETLAAHTARAVRRATGELETALARARDENDARLATERQELERLAASVTQAREELRRVNAAHAVAEREAADRVSATLASAQEEIARANAARADADLLLNELRAAHKAEMARLDESLAHLLDRERTAAMKRLTEPNDTVAQAVNLAVSKARRVAEAELATALEESERAHALDLEAARNEVRRLLDRDVQRRVEVEKEILTTRAAEDGTRADEERLRRKLEEERIEHEAAMWGVTRQASEALEDERHQTATAIRQLESRHADALHALEIELSSVDQHLMELRAKQQAELSQVDASVARMLEQERKDHEAAMATLVAVTEERVLAAERQLADTEVLQRELRASRATREDLSRARDALMEALDLQRAEHAAALKRAASDAEKRVTAVEAELAEQAARNRELYAAHRHEAGRAHTLDEALRASLSTHKDLIRERDALKRWLEVERAEHAASQARTEHEIVHRRTTRPPPASST